MSALNNSTSVSAGSSGIGFTGLLTLLFIGLKLTGYITWSWIWVLSPLWMGIALIGVVCAMIAVAAGLLYLVEKLLNKSSKK